MYQIILASESPRRKEIMRTMGIPFTAVSVDVLEETKETEPAPLVQALAKLKTEAVEQKLTLPEEQDYIIIGADTMVFYQNQALGKPKDEADAFRMLQLLSDDTHEVYTGVNLLIHKANGSKESISFAVGTKVVVQPLTEEQIRDYIATGEPMDKAGAYAIQGAFGIYIKEIIGDYYNVVGFPIAKIYEVLLNRGIDIKK